jgi:hypothetical protein
MRSASPNLDTTSTRQDLAPIEEDGVGLGVYSPGSLQPYAGLARDEGKRLAAARLSELGSRSHIDGNSSVSLDGGSGSRARTRSEETAGTKFKSSKSAHSSEEGPAPCWPIRACETAAREPGGVPNGKIASRFGVASKL